MKLLLVQTILLETSKTFPSLSAASSSRFHTHVFSPVPQEHRAYLERTRQALKANIELRFSVFLPLKESVSFVFLYLVFSFSRYSIVGKDFIIQSSFIIFLAALSKEVILVIYPSLSIGRS